MADEPSGTPFGGRPVEGVVHRRSPHSVDGTVERLSHAVQGAGAKLFAVIDQRAEAEAAGLRLRETRLVLFGSPVAGTPIMDVVPVSALDLPLKVLVWADDEGAVWMTYLSSQWLAHRYQLPSELAKPLSAPDALTTRVAGSG